jgi:flagellar protein FliO/FliZ
MTLRAALTSAGTALLGMLLLAPVALAADGESSPLNLPADNAAKKVAAPGAGGGIVRTIVGLAVVLGVIYGLYWVLKQVKASKEDKATGRGLEPLANLPLGGNRSLQLVRAGSEIVLVGVGESGVTPVRTYSEAEARALGLIADADDADGAMRGEIARLGEGGDPFTRRPTFRQAVARGLDDLRKRTVIK